MRFKPINIYHLPRVSAVVWSSGIWIAIMLSYIILRQSEEKPLPAYWREDRLPAVGGVDRQATRDAKVAKKDK